jgi:hypothetical protein
MFERKLIKIQDVRDYDELVSGEIIIGAVHNSTTTTLHLEKELSSEELTYYEVEYPANSYVRIKIYKD